MRINDSSSDVCSSDLKLAKWALAAKNRWDLHDPGDGIDAKEAAFAAKMIRDRVRVLPADKALPDEVYALIDRRGACRTAMCVAYVLADDRVALVSQVSGIGFFAHNPKSGDWADDYRTTRPARQPGDSAADLATATVEVRPVTQRQFFVDGKPAGEPFE